MFSDTQASATRPTSAMLSRNSLEFAFTTVVIPNFLFLVTAPFYIASRLISPFLFLAAGIAGLFLPAPLTYLIFLAAAVADITLVVMIAFHLPLDVAADSLKYMATINPASSLLYVSIALIVTATTVLAAHRVCRNRDRLRQASLVPALVMAGALSTADLVWTQPYFRKADIMFDSARAQAGLSADAVIEDRSNLLIVVVEGLGAFADPQEHDLFKSILTDNLPQDRYEVEEGQTYYSGSTTGAAARELCGRWGDYIDYLTGMPGGGCLPNRLAAAGYETIAFHGFTTDMFRRDLWYPAIGFQKLEFMEQLQAARPAAFARHCGSVFAGLCDADVGRAVQQTLVADPERPKFIYWLTLNSHIPFVQAEEDRLGCRTQAPKIRNKTVCELSNLWSIVFEQVNAIATDPNLPPTDILIVGDHHTPLWERAAKDRFVLGKVDWFLLRHNRDASPDGHRPRSTS